MQFHEPSGIGDRIGRTVSVILMTYAERDSIRRVIEGFEATGVVDEIVVVNPNGKVIAKLGDFYGVDDGVPRGLLFPASLAFSADGKRIETSVSRGDEKSSERVLSYEGLSESELIGKEIQILGHDRVYEQAVLAAGELVKAIRV